MSPDLARLLNMTGQRDKKAFQALRLNHILVSDYFLVFVVINLYQNTH